MGGGLAAALRGLQVSLQVSVNLSPQIPAFRKGHLPAGHHSLGTLMRERRTLDAVLP